MTQRPFKSVYFVRRKDWPGEYVTAHSHVEAVARSGKTGKILVTDGETGETVQFIGVKDQVAGIKYYRKGSRETRHL